MDIDRYICQARSEIRSNEMHMFLKHARSNNTETCEPIISNESYQRIDKNSENNAATKESTREAAMMTERNEQGGETIARLRHVRYDTIMLRTESRNETSIGSDDGSVKIVEKIAMQRLR